MKLQILDKTEKPLFSRTELQVEVVFDKSTPSRAEIIKELAAKLNTKDDLIALKSVYTSFGVRKAAVTANVYKNKKDFETSEPKYISERGKEKKKEEGKTEEAKEKKEESKEEKKEEVKEETKSEEQKEEQPKEQQQEKPAEQPKEEVKKDSEEVKEEVKDK